QGGLVVGIEEGVAVGVEINAPIGQRFFRAPADAVGVGVVINDAGDRGVGGGCQREEEVFPREDLRVAGDGHDVFAGGRGAGLQRGRGLGANVVVAGGDVG